VLEKRGKKTGFLLLRNFPFYNLFCIASNLENNHVIGGQIIIPILDYWQWFKSDG